MRCSNISRALRNSRVVGLVYRTKHSVAYLWPTCTGKRVTQTSWTFR